MTLPPGLEAILFDLDGTLLDSFPLHLAAYQDALGAFGISLSAEEFRRTYTPDWREFCRVAGLPPERWEDAGRVWRASAESHRPGLLPDVVPALERLVGRFRMGIVTAGSGWRVTADLERTGLARFFTAVVTGDDVTRQKPAPDGLQAALRQLDRGPASALYIGDTPSDAAAARAAGVPFLAVESEFCPGWTDGARLGSVARLPSVLFGEA